MAFFVDGSIKKSARRWKLLAGGIDIFALIRTLDYFDHSYRVVKKYALLSVVNRKGDKALNTPFKPSKIFPGRRMIHCFRSRSDLYMNVANLLVRPSIVRSPKPVCCNS